MSTSSAASALSRKPAAASVAGGLPAATHSSAHFTSTALHTPPASQPAPHRTGDTASGVSVDSSLVDPPFAAGSPPLPAISPLLQSWLRPYTAGPLTEAELAQYQQWGYCIKRNVLSEEDLLPAMRAVEAQVDTVADSLYAAGLIRDKCEQLDLFHRLTALEQQFPSCSVLLHKLGVLDRGIARLWEHPALLGIAQQVIGPDVAAHPNWSLRSKTPHQEQATVPWHQDSAYLEPEADHTLQMTAWMYASQHTRPAAISRHRQLTCSPCSLAALLPLLCSVPS